MHLCILHTIFLINTFAICNSGETVSVTLSSGTIFGSLCPSPSYNIAKFLGIPYAQPPISTLRWSAPVAYNGQYPNGILNATAFSPGCYQFGRFGNEAPYYSEDW